MIGFMPPLSGQTNTMTLLTFAFFTAVALVAAIYLFREEAKATGCELQKIDRLCFWVLIAAICGARLFYFVGYPEAMAAGVTELFRIWNGGVSLAGGVGVAAVAGVGCVRAFKLPLLRTLDALAPGVAIGQFFIWLGCFFSGLCQPAPEVAFGGSQSTAPAADAMTSIALHPASLFIAAGHFAVFGLLLVAKQRRRFNGQTFWQYILLVGILGLLKAQYDAVEHVLSIFGLPSTSVVNALLAVTAIAALLVLGRRGKKNKRSPSRFAAGDSESSTAMTDAFDKPKLP